MMDLSPLGLFHTLISLVAISSGVIALVTEKHLLPTNRVGKVYVVSTLVTAITALGIARHGVIGPGHVLAGLTLMELGAAWLAMRGTWFGAWSPLVASSTLSATFLIHLLTGSSETLTRLPVSSPLLASADGLGLRLLHLALVAVYVVSVARRARSHRLRLASSAEAAGLPA